VCNSWRGLNVLADARTRRLLALRSAERSNQVALEDVSQKQ